MQLTILGSNGTYPTAGRPASGYLVTHEGSRLWMDAGSGTYGALAAEMDPTDLDAVFLSHRHPDHCADIFALFHAIAYGPAHLDPIPVIVPEGLADRLADFVGSSSDRMREVLDFRTVNAGMEITIASFDIAIAEAYHPPPTIAPRISAGGASLTYTADTGPSEALEEHARGSDLLLAEATLAAPRQGDAFPYHLTGVEAGLLAASAGVRRLMLTHIAPHVDSHQSVIDAESTFDGEVSLAVPGARVTV